MIFFRLIYIKYIFLKYGLDKLLWVTPYAPLQLLKIFFPWRWFQEPVPPSGKDIRKAFIELGPIFVKFGQLLSTRRDILPDDIALELAKLQDKVPPFCNDLALKTIQKNLKKPINEIFNHIEKIPLASASIAQVHAAELLNGDEVVIKVLRPHIKKRINRDVALMAFLAKWINRLTPQAKRFRPNEVVQEFKTTLNNELDLMREAANASQLRRNFMNSPILYIPKIYWEATNHNIMVMERIEGIRVTDIEKLKQANINLKLLAERGVEIFFTQVFNDCFFHADMHPGNIFVSKINPQSPKYLAVDFGIVGTLGPNDKHYLAENFLAFFNRDYRRVAELHIKSGWVGNHVRVDEFESAIRAVCEPIFERPLKDISFGQSLLKLFQTARQFDMEIQPQLLLLQKTLLSIEGLGRELYPELDLWNTAKPFLEKWMKTQIGPKAFFNNIKEKLPQWVDKMPDMPEALYDVIKHFQQEAHAVKRGQLPSSTPHHKQNHLMAKLFGATSLIIGILLFFKTDPTLIIQEYSHLFGLGFGVIGLILFSNSR